MKKVKHIPQIIETECGLCCTAMIAQYYESFFTLNDLRDLLDPGRDGIDIKSLRNLLVSIGFESKVYKINPENITKLTFPCILYWENRHFVILEQMSDKYFTIVDPALGRIKINKDEFGTKFSNIVITAIPSKEFTKKCKEKNIWFSFLDIILKSKKMLALVIFISILYYGFSLIIPMITEKIIDNGKNISTQFLLSIILIISSYILILSFRGVFQVFLKSNMFSDFSKYIFSHLINVPYNYFESRSYGNLLFSLESIGIVKNLYAEKLITFFINSGAIICMIIYLAIKAPIIALIITIILIIIGIVLKSLSTRILMLNQMEIVGLTKLQSIQVELIYSMLNIKIAGIEDKVYENWEKQFDSTLSKTKTRDINQNFYTTVSSAFQIIVPILLLIILSLLYTNIYSIGEIIAFYTIVNNISMYSVDVFTTINYFELSSQYLERVKDITDQKCEKNGSIKIDGVFKGNLLLKDVSFKYNKRSASVLKNINMTIEFGKKIAIVGKSGSGKSTLGKIILGLYEPTDGNIFYSDIDLKDIDKRVLRKFMGIVPQDNSLFNKTILENIRMNRTEITEDEVKEACKIAQIDKEIENMPMKYNTLISDMGMNISGGQRQRILLARAIVSRPQIILFDEATSSLDSINESKISEQLKNNGCTRIIIAHRLSTIIDADCIFVLDKGEVVEYGNHHELLKKDGVYKELYYTSK